MQEEQAEVSWVTRAGEVMDEQKRTRLMINLYRDCSNMHAPGTVGLRRTGTFDAQNRNGFLYITS